MAKTPSRSPGKPANIHDRKLARGNGVAARARATVTPAATFDEVAATTAGDESCAAA